MGRRRRRGEEEHENHERWLVSYADFITLLFAFFVVMYSLSSVNEGKYRVLSDALTQAFRSGDMLDGHNQMVPPAVISGSMVESVRNTPPSDDDFLNEPPRVITPEVSTELAQRQAQTREALRDVASEIRDVLAPLTRDGTVRVSEGEFGISVEINARVLFDSGGAELGPEARTALQAVAAVIAPASFPVTVEGHTDNVPIRTARFPSNWELSAVRASSVVRLFVESGVNPDRLTAAGYGDQRPIGDNTTEEGRSRNRRVAIQIEASEFSPPVGGAPGEIRRDDALRSFVPALR